MTITKEYLEELRAETQNKISQLDKTNPINLPMDFKLQGELQLLDRLLIHIDS